MAEQKQVRPIPGSEHRVPEGARHAGHPDPNDTAEVTVLLRYRDEPPAVDALGLQRPHERPHLTHSAFEERHGADPAYVDRVVAFAREHNLQVVETDLAHRTVVLGGTLGDLCRAFNVAFADFEHPHGTYRGYTGAVHVPHDLEPIVQGVFGLHNRPLHRPRANDIGSSSASTRFTPLQLADHYHFPPDTDGTGQTIGLIELAGGYRDVDLASYFESLALPTPHIEAISVAGGTNRPSSDPDNNEDAEVQMDIQVAAALAPGARFKVYFTTPDGFLRAVKKAISDGVTVLSISWGLTELYMEPNYMDAFNDAFRDAAALGITVCVASGDLGSSDGVPDKDDPRHLAHVEFPASSPYVLACGGTMLTPSDAATSEVVWNDPALGFATGGGISAHFGLPEYQQAAGVPPSANPDKRVGRGVPDVAAQAVGYAVQINGHERRLGGTSAVAPLWAALIARINQHLGHQVGYINPLLYAQGMGSGVFNEVTSGTNGAYQAASGWNACTGLGTPNGSGLLQALC